MNRDIKTAEPNVMETNWEKAYFKDTVSRAVATRKALLRSIEIHPDVDRETIWPAAAYAETLFGLARADDYGFCLFGSTPKIETMEEDLKKVDETIRKYREEGRITCAPFSLHGMDAYSELMLYKQAEIANIEIKRDGAPHTVFNIGVTTPEGLRGFLVVRDPDGHFEYIRCDYNNVIWHIEKGWYRWSEITRKN